MRKKSKRPIQKSAMIARQDGLQWSRRYDFGTVILATTINLVVGLVTSRYQPVSAYRGGRRERLPR
jgi:hypothetical protein